MERKSRSKSPYYQEFLDGKEMKIINIEDIYKACKNIKRFKKAGTALLSILYYTGARPDEVLKLHANNISLQKSTLNGKEHNFLKIQLETVKRGIARVIRLDMSKPIVKDIYDYSSNYPPNAFIFYMFKGSYKRIGYRKGKPTERIEISDLFRYYFNKWFKGVLRHPIPPYYLRHNRLTKLSMSGATVEQLRLFKGAKSPDSVIPYLHQSRLESEKIALINE